LSRAIPLVRHPDSARGAVNRIEAALAWYEDGTLAVQYRLSGDLMMVAIPPPKPAQRADGLWKHTSFEAFVMVGGGPAYYEFNFAPSTEWAVYAFIDYRKPAPRSQPGPGFLPGIVTDTEDAIFRLTATVPLHRLPSMKLDGPLHVGLSAVIEDRDGALAYWAVKHRAGAPDFHCADGFAVEIRAPGTAPSFSGR
jgi:hypothetical protein